MSSGKAWGIWSSSNPIDRYLKRFYYFKIIKLTNYWKLIIIWLKIIFEIELLNLLAQNSHRFLKKLDFLFLILIK